MTDVDFIAEMIHFTDQAYLLYDGVNKIWIPKSQILNYDELPDKLEKGVDYEFIIPEWLAIEKEVI